MRVMMENVDLYAEVEQVILIMRERAAKARITLQFNVPEDINIVVLGDADRLNQVFINILDNAIKHSSEDTTIKISIVETATHAAVCIEDAGEGIPADELPHIKEKFFKGTSSKRGTGLGLAVADEIVRLARRHAGHRERTGQGHKGDHRPAQKGAARAGGRGRIMEQNPIRPEQSEQTVQTHSLYSPYTRRRSAARPSSRACDARPGKDLRRRPPPRR